MYSVLLVDDESIIIDGLKQLIHWEDYGLELKGTARDGQAALEMMMSDHFDILITDIKMPVMDGLTLLKKIEQNHLSIKSLIISGYDEFDYVKEAIRYGIENYLLKPVNEEELSATVLNLVNKLDKEKDLQVMTVLNVDNLFENIFYRMLTGNIEFDELQDRARLLNIKIDKKFYLTATVRIFFDPEKNIPIKAIRSYIIKMKEELINCEFTKGLDNNNCCYIAISPDNELMILMGSDAPIDVKSIRNSLNTLLSSLYGSLGYNWFAAIGSLADGVENIPGSYLNSQKMLLYKFIMPYNTIVNYEGMIERSSNVNHKLNIDYRKLDNLLLSDSEEECIQTLNDSFLKIQNQPNISVQELKSLIAEILFHVLGSDGSRSDLFEESENSYILYNILNMSSIDDIKSWLIDISTNKIRMKIEKSKNLNPIAKSVLEYVKGHYNEEISLKTLADKFNVNPTYCGQIFKHETGMLFTEYLCNYRIDLAKQIISETNMKSREVASKVGFSNSNYFANVFKKKVGVYPTKYKKLISNTQTSP